MTDVNEKSKKSTKKANDLIKEINSKKISTATKVNADLNFEKINVYVEVDYELDDYKRIKLSADTAFLYKDIEEKLEDVQENIYLSLLASLRNIINITMLK